MFASAYAMGRETRARPRAGLHGGRVRPVCPDNNGQAPPASGPERGAARSPIWPGRPSPARSCRRRNTAAHGIEHRRPGPACLAFGMSRRAHLRRVGTDTAGQRAGWTPRPSRGGPGITPPTRASLHPRATPSPRAYAGKCGPTAHRPRRRELPVPRCIRKPPRAKPRTDTAGKDAVGRCDQGQAPGHKVPTRRHYVSPRSLPIIRRSGAP